MHGREGEDRKEEDEEDERKRERDGRMNKGGEREMKTDKKRSKQE